MNCFEFPSIFSTFPSTRLLANASRCSACRTNPRSNLRHISISKAAIHKNNNNNNNEITSCRLIFRACNFPHASHFLTKVQQSRLKPSIPRSIYPASCLLERVTVLTSNKNQHQAQRSPDNHAGKKRKEEKKKKKKCVAQEFIGLFEFIASICWGILGEWDGGKTV